jgi:hypothetical protein
VTSESELHERIRRSETQLVSQKCIVRLVRADASDVEIKPRNVGEDTEGWSVGKEKIPTDTLEQAIIVAMEMQARERDA